MKTAAVPAVEAILALASAGSVEKVRELLAAVRLMQQHAPGAPAASVEFVVAGGRDSPMTLASWQLSRPSSDIFHP